MNKKFEYIIWLGECTVYDGFDKLRQSISYQDDMKHRIIKGGYIEYLSSTLIYHLIIEKMLISILKQNTYCLSILDDGLQRNDQKIKHRESKIKKASFSGLVKILTDDNKILNEKNLSLIIKKGKEFNGIRNKLVHETVNYTPENIVKMAENVKDKYDNIKDIYIETSIQKSNKIQKKARELMVYMLQEYKKNHLDKKELEKYIVDNIDAGEIVEYGSMAIELYISLYKNEDKERLFYEINSDARCSDTPEYDILSRLGIIR